MNQKILRALEIFRQRPDFFAEEVFEFGHFKKHKIELWSKQRELLRAIAKHERVTVRSGHKTGKSFSAGIASWWWFMTRPEAKVILIAPSTKQLNRILWSEVYRMGNSMVVKHGARIYEQVHTGVQSKDGRQIFGFTGRTKPENAAGFSGKILYVLDEASGLSNEIHEVVDTVPNGAVLSISNPTVPYGAFFNQHQPESSWHKIHLSSIDAAAENTWLGSRWKYEHLANKRWVDARRADYKEGSYYWTVRVCGDFPSVSTDTVISDQVIRGAMGRPYESIKGQDVHIGVDVARYGDDQSAIATRIGMRLIGVSTYRKENNVEIASRVAREIDRYLLRDNDIRVHVKIDCTNGGGVADILEERYGNNTRVNIVQVMYQGRSDSPHYVRVRDQLWFEMAQWLESASIPRDDNLRSELINVKYQYADDGKRLVESKKDLKARIHRSPDSADALALAIHHEDNGSGFYEVLNMDRVLA